MTKVYNPKGSIIAALDIGMHKNVCLIARFIDDNGNLEIIGVGHQSTKGIKSGLISSMGDLEQSVRQTVHAAENMAANVMKGYPLRDVILNVSDNQILSDNILVQLELSDAAVEQNDINKALLKAYQQIDQSKHQLIHSIPYGYNLDGKGEVAQPIGMVAETLDLNIHTITAENKYLSNIIGCIEKSHLDVVALCSSTYASGLSCLVEDEVDLGCILIDMGAGSTSFSIFESGTMIFRGSVPIGGSHVTSDIAKGLNCSAQDAERIKTLYGSSIVTTHDDAELIDVPQLGESEASNKVNHVPRSLLIGIIQPRLEEIFEMIREQLDQFSQNKSLSRRIILTGGASQLPGMRDLCQMVLDKQVRLGRPIHINNLPDAASGPAFSTAAGLLLYYAHHQHEMPSEIVENAVKDTVWIRFKNWWKENW
ncbi:MAG: cell division protein FtsA [Pseudomonadota bacterium]